MANRYVVAAGGNYNASATWETSPGAADSPAVPTSSDAVILTALSGQLTVNATAAAASVDASAHLNTITHQAFTWTVAGSFTLGAGLTYTPTFAESSGSASILALSASGTLTTAGKAMPRINITGGTTTLGDNLTFGASKFCFLTLSGNVLDLNGKTVAGNSVTNRPLITSNTRGTARTITINSGTFTNCDFEDITASASLDLSAGSAGDCGGNSNITFTTAATQTATGTTSFTWSTHGWTSRVPLPQDDVSIPNAFSASQTVTWDMPRSGKSITFTCTGNPTLDPNIDVAFFGSLTLASGMTWSSGNDSLFFRGRGSYNLTTNGVSIATNGNSSNIQAPGGTLTFLSDVTWGGDGTHGIVLENGTLDTNGFALTTPRLSSSGTSTRALDISNSTITLTGTGGAWGFSTVTNLTFTSTGSTISMTDVSATGKTFDGGGMTYNNLSITSDGSAGTTTFTGANTFASWTIGAGGIKSIILPGATTTTFSSPSTGLGNGTNVITFTASSGSATIACASPGMSWDYVNLTNIIASGSTPFYAGANSVDGGGNTNWTFTAPPTSSGNMLLLLMAA